MAPPTEPCHINKGKNTFCNTSHCFICSLKFSKFMFVCTVCVRVFCQNRCMSLYAHVCGSVRRLAIHTCNFSTTLHLVVRSLSLIVILPVWPMCPKYPLVSASMALWLLTFLLCTAILCGFWGLSYVLVFISQALHKLIYLSLILSIIDKNPCKYKVNLSKSLWLRVPRPRKVPTAIILPNRHSIYLLSEHRSLYL